MASDEIDSLVLSGFERLVDHGFALPLFASQERPNAWYVARSTRPGDRTALIESFDFFEPSDLVEISPHQRRAVRTGDRWHDVFLWDGKAYVGTERELWRALRHLIDEIAASAPMSAVDLCPLSESDIRGAIALSCHKHLESTFSERIATSWRNNIYFRNLARTFFQKELGYIPENLVSVISDFRLLSVELRGCAPLPINRIDAITGSLQEIAQKLLGGRVRVRIIELKSEPDADVSSRFRSIRPLRSSIRDVIQRTSSESPVVLTRPDAIEVAARWFSGNLHANLIYPVCVNPSPWVIIAANDAGVSRFSVSSLAEIELVHSLVPNAEMMFLHPVKNRRAIQEAYSKHGISTFGLDSIDELKKILDATGGNKELNLLVRLAVPPQPEFKARKFGVDKFESFEILHATKNATSGKFGVSIHVGNQCMNPKNFVKAQCDAAAWLHRAGIEADLLCIGDGLPTVYPGLTPPNMSEFSEAIHRGLKKAWPERPPALWMEVGRALVAESSSLLCRIDLKKGDALYLNDGVHGCLFEAGALKWPYPVRLVRREESSGKLRPFRFYGPTMDKFDHMPGPFWLPEDTTEGDYVEIGMLGAFGVAMRSRYSGLGDLEIAEVSDPPIASMFGLARRSIPSTGLQ